MQIKNIIELFNIINNKKTVVYNQVRFDNLKKLWQIEKITENKYCLKTFNCYNQINKKYFFYINKEENNNEILRIITIIKKDININQKLLKQLLSTKIYNKYFKDFIPDIKRKSKWFTYKFTTFTTKKNNNNGNKDGENNIRKYLNVFIKKRHKLGITQNEYTTYTLKSRADVVVFEPKLIHIYEIKSEKDSFIRLEKQIEDYKKYGEKITLVIDIKKLKTFKKNYKNKYPEIEIIIFNNKKLSVYQKGKTLIPNFKFGLLWKKELYINIIKNKLLNSSKLSQLEMVKEAEKLFNLTKANKIVNSIIYKRQQNKLINGKLSEGYIDINNL